MTATTHTTRPTPRRALTRIGLALFGTTAVLLALTRPDGRAADPIAPPTGAVPPNKPEANPPPKTLEEGLARIEKVLGKYDAENQHEWRLPTKFDHKSRPVPDKPEVLARFDGMTVVGHPFVASGSICFDVVMEWKREVYDLGEGEKKTLTRSQRSHNVTRYLLTLNEGTWLVSGTMLSNGVHNSVGRDCFSGVVRWHADGVELVGNASLDRFYGPGGSWILGIPFGSYRYSREGESLILKYEFQPYHLATGPGGVTTTAPDFKRPFGAPYDMTFRSETSGSK